MAVCIYFPDYDITIYPLVDNDNHSFLNKSNFSRLYLMVVIVFQTMISQSTRWKKTTSTLFRTTLIFPTLSDGCDCFPHNDITTYSLAEDDPHSFLNNSNFSRLYLMAMIVFQTMI